MAVVTTRQSETTNSSETPRLPRITFHQVWSVLIVVFWVAILIGILGDFFIFKKPTILGFKENGTLWNWLQLLSAPVFVSVLPFVFKGQRNSSDSKEAESKSQTDATMAVQQTQELALEAYQDHILSLVLDRNLRGSEPGSDVREAARARTLTILRRLDKDHKGDVLHFLHEAGLIFKGKAIIDLREADLSGANLSNAHLDGANLQGAIYK